MTAVSVCLLFFGVIYFTFLSPVCAQDPCTSYSVLNDESRSVLKTSSSYTWDYYISGWYRFMGKAGDKMLDYPPTAGSGHRCTANVPGYLSGQHPRGSDGVVSRTVCFVFSGNTCWTSTTIQVKNCGNHFVYRLNALTSSYYLRYCGSGEVENNYPCKHYKLLTERTRIASYRRQVNDQCDRYMNGWYRFWGNAGSRMLEKCPKVDDQPVFYCGAYYHGWLNATNPVPLDGTVNRTMCFSDITTCNCNKSIAKQIQMRNCGNYFVYKLNDLSDICRRDLANNARYCGMRDKDAYQVTCSAIYMRIDLDRRYYNSSSYKSITLLNPRCKYTLSYDYITLGCIPGACGSEMKETATEIVYVNAVKLTTSFGATLISKDNNETIRFQCSYKKDAFLPIGSFDPVGEVSDSLENFGNFSFHFNTYRTNKFSNAVKNFPVKLKLRDWLYFEVNATVEDSSLTLLIDECYSTPTMNPEEPTKYHLIKDRCATDITTSFIPGNGLKRRFSMQVFQSENTKTAFIHCLVFFCRKNSTNSRCKSGCFGNNINSRKRRSLTDSGNAEHTQFYKLDSGIILLDVPVIPPKKESEGTTTTILVFIGLAGLVLILIIIVIILVLRRRAPLPSDGKYNNDIGMDNVGRDASDYPTMNEKSSIVA